MANEQQKGPSDSAAAEQFLHELKTRAEDCHKRNDVFMMSLYTDVLKVVSPIVTRSIARSMREERARLNSMHAELRAQAAAEREKKREAKRNQSGPNATTRLGD
jgi:hypothetical protein